MGYIGTKPTAAPLTSSQLEDGLVTAAKLATDAVETAKVKDINITTAKITDLNVTNAKLANSSITIDGSAIALGGSVTTGTSPTYTSITPSISTNDATTFVIAGTNFGASGIPTVEFQNLTGGITVATSVVRDSTTQLTVVATLAVDGTYYIRIELNSGLAVRSSAADLTISDAPVWTTGSGTLGTIAGDFSGTVATVAATGDTVTYSEVSGTGLTGAGNANCSLNTSTGVITTTDFGGSSTSPTTYNFTIRATDAQSQTADRAFSLTSSFTYTVDWLVVAGGAGGATSAGGGAGGFRAGASLPLTPANAYTVTVGTGGAGKGAIHGVDGVDSILSGTGITTVTSTGGGGGAPQNVSLEDGRDGGSGGGEGYGRGTGTVGAGNTPAITPITGETTTVQGFAGGLGYSDLATYTGGGPGGGASEVGANNVTTTAGDGGDGSANSITGASVTYAGGGGGSIGAGHTSGSGGAGGGGNGTTSGSGIAGTDGLGGGGGGCGGTGLGGDGGDGVVILRILTSDYTGTTTGSPTVTTDGSYKVVKFLVSGSYTA